MSCVLNTSFIFPDSFCRVRPGDGPRYGDSYVITT